jgi:hypothetical protein
MSMQFHIPEATHWYMSDGSPVLHVHSADVKCPDCGGKFKTREEKAVTSACQACGPKGFVPGPLRKPTAADAKKHGYEPGVTGVLGILRNTGLEKYSTKQAIEATITSPNVPLYFADKISEVVLLERLQVETEEHRNAAADRGKRIHALDEHFAKYGEHPDDTTTVERLIVSRLETVMARLIEEHGAPNSHWMVEVPFTDNAAHYGGRIDRISSCGGLIVDLKTREWKEGETPECYFTSKMQVVAYLDGLRRSNGIPLHPNPVYAVVIAHRENEELDPHPYVLKQKDVDKARRVFYPLLETFHALRGLGPYERFTFTQTV